MGREEGGLWLPARPGSESHGDAIECPGGQGGWLLSNLVKHRTSSVLRAEGMSELFHSSSWGMSYQSAGAQSLETFFRLAWGHNWEAPCALELTSEPTMRGLLLCPSPDKHWVHPDEA